MVPIIGQGLMLENGGCSVAIDRPKYKRRRVSAVRDFPPGCGPCAPKTEVGVSEALCCVNNIENVVHPAGAGVQSNKSSYAAEIPASLNDVNQSTYNASKDGEHEIIKDEHAGDGLVKSSEDLRSDHLPGESALISCNSKEPLHIHVDSAAKESLDKTQEASDNSMKVDVDVPDALNSTVGLDSKDGIELLAEVEEVVVEGNLTPHHPIPSAVVWKERNYPPRRRVSCVRDFPPRCDSQIQTSLNTNCTSVDAPQEMRNANHIKMASENNKADANLGVEDTKDQIHDVSVLETQMVEVSRSRDGTDAPTGDNDALQECSMQPVQSSLEPQPSAPDMLMDEGVQSKQLTLECDRKMEERASPSRGTKDIVFYRKGKGGKKRTTFYPDGGATLHAEDAVPSHHEEGMVVVQGLMAAVKCPWQNESEVNKATSSAVGAKGSRRKRGNVVMQGKLKSDPDEAMTDSQDCKEKRADEKNESEVNRATSSAVDAKGSRRKRGNVVKQVKMKSRLNEVLTDSRDCKEKRADEMATSMHDASLQNDKHLSLVVQSRDVDVIPPPFGASSSGDKGARSKVREALRLFQTVLRKILQEEETKTKGERKAGVRIDQRAAKILKDKGIYVNTGKPIVGPVPGVEVGDEFHYRVELMVVGIHRQSQSGIDFLKVGKKIIATSMVDSGGYDNDVDSSDVLTYMGQGGNLTGGDKVPEDQKLERGNLALKNSIEEKNPVRVIRGVKETKSSETPDGRAKILRTYTYNGLYTVDRYWQDIGPQGKKVFKFELRRLPGQPELAWREVKKSKKFKIREGRCVDDISGGKERFPICAVNTVDDEKPPPFTYINKTIYPSWCNPLPLQGCDCINGCSDSGGCACAVKNGGEIPFNFDGAIVQAKTLVFECGPSCKCPASCHNRVSQHGMKFQLEIFKTRDRGWGVRSLSSIPSGSFVCEYIGELLEEKEANQRTGNDEYLFDIGQNYNDQSLWEGLSGLIPPPSSSEVVTDVGFTIDAAQCGNVGRFINHCCSPNLYAQNVLYDHDDTRIPHIMFFAAENIPPLQELTYHYNYAIGEVIDNVGNVKTKNCYCGASDCSGRMY